MTAGVPKTTRSFTGLATVVLLALAFGAEGGGAATRSPRSQVQQAQSQYAYVSNSGSQNVTMYKVNQNSGQLESVGTVPVDGNTPQAIAVAPSENPDQFAVSGRPVFVVNQNSNNVSMYTINPGTGQLNPVGTVPAGSSPQAVAVTPSGDMAFVANGDSNNLSVYKVSPANGALQASQPVATGQNPVAIAMNPSGNVVYVANQGSNNISTYQVNESNGTLTPAGPPASMPPGSGSPSSIAVLPTGTIAVATSPTTNSMGVFVVNPNPSPFLPGLVPLTSVPVNGGPTSISIGEGGITAITLMSQAPSANGSTQQLGAIAIYQITQAGTVLFKGIAPAGNGPINVAVDPSGAYAYVVNRNANNVSAFAITSGLPLPLGTVQAGTSPRGLALAQ